MTVNIHFFQGSDSAQFQPAIIQGNHLTCLRQDGLACDRQPDAGACACEQLDSQFLFHGLEGLRQTGLRQIEFLGGSPDGTCFCVYCGRILLFFIAHKNLCIIQIFYIMLT